MLFLLLLLHHQHFLSSKNPQRPAEHMVDFDILFIVLIVQKHTLALRHADHHVPHPVYALVVRKCAALDFTIFEHQHDLDRVGRRNGAELVVSEIFR